MVGVKDDVDDDVGAGVEGSGGAGGGIVSEGGEGVIGAQVGIGRIGAGVEVLDVHVGVGAGGAGGAGFTPPEAQVGIGGGGRDFVELHVTVQSKMVVELGRVGSDVEFIVERGVVVLPVR